MTFPPEELRRSMRQEFTHNLTRLDTKSYFEAFETSAFDPAGLATLFHENSKYHEGLMGAARRSVVAFESAPMAYTQAKLRADHPGRDRVRLPAPDPVSGVSLGQALRNRRSATRFAGGTITVRDLATILSNACGITGALEIDHDRFTTTIPKPLRAYPSAGGLYPVEVYLLVNDVTGIPSGRYYYVPDRHDLRVIGTDGGERLGVDDAFVGIGGGAGAASVIVVLTAAFWRGMAKYGPRGYRYALQESGHLAQNLLLMAASLGLAALPIGGFYDDAVDGLIGIDGVNESTVYGVAIGQPVDTPLGGGDR